MPAEKRELYSSSNGDRWFLVRKPETGRLFVRHEANIPSGGRVTDVDIGPFLSEGPRHPEHQALLHLIGTLVGSDPHRTAAKRVNLAIPTRQKQKKRRPPKSPPRARATTRIL